MFMRRDILIAAGVTPSRRSQPVRQDGPRGPDLPGGMSGPGPYSYGVLTSQLNAQTAATRRGSMHTRLTHVRANVRDLDNYAHFVAAEGATFAVMVAEPVPSAARFNFSVADVDGLWERLKDRVTVIEPLHDTPYGMRKFTIADPDGNQLGFVWG